jgi:phosphatidate phosphatase APP1
MELMSNEERKGAAVTVRVGDREWQAVTDNEGYFRVAVTDLALMPGWHAIVANSGPAAGESRLLIAAQDNVHGVISDVDDTIQVTEVNSTRRMLANTFLQNPLQRQAVDGAPEFYHELVAANADAANAPMFYLSASPRQLHGLLEIFLEKNGFPRGVLMTKRVTNDSSSDPLRDQFAYKTAKLEEIFARLPHVRFTLLGDDGEADPEIFAAIRARYPERVAEIWIRRVNPDPKRARLPGQKNLNERLAQKKTPQ